MVVDVHKIISYWDESVVTWSTRPNYDPLVITSLSINGADKWYEFDITPLVQYWYLNGNNFGLLLKQKDENTNAYVDFLVRNIMIIQNILN